jgi:hypothetical protein
MLELRHIPISKHGFCNVLGGMAKQDADERSPSLHLHFAEFPGYRQKMTFFSHDDQIRAKVATISE